MDTLRRHGHRRAGAMKLLPLMVFVATLLTTMAVGGLGDASRSVGAYDYDGARTTAGSVGWATPSILGEVGEWPDDRGHSAFGEPYDHSGNLARASARLDGYRLAPQATRPLFSQTTASPTFRHGSFAGQSIGDVAGGLRAGKINPAELPVDVIVRNGETIGLNTRSMLALRRGGIDPSEWLLNDVTGVPGVERLLTERLLRNGLTGGTDILRITGAGPNASNLL